MIHQEIVIDGYAFEIVCGSPLHNGIILDPHTPISGCQFIKALEKAQTVYSYYDAYFHLISGQGNDWIRDIKCLGETHDNLIDFYIARLQEAFQAGWLLEYQDLFYGWCKQYDDAKAWLVSKTTVKPSRKTAPSAGFVYLIRTENNLYKIGLSKSPQSRIKNISNVIPFDVEIISIIESDDMVSLEKDLHRRFLSQRVSGEWFNLSPEDVEYIKGLTE